MDVAPPGLVRRSRSRKVETKVGTEQEGGKQAGPGLGRVETESGGAWPFLFFFFFSVLGDLEELGRGSVVEVPAAKADNLSLNFKVNIVEGENRFPEVVCHL